MTFVAAGQLYHVEFRHRTKFGRRPELHAKSPVNAVTVCAISGYDRDDEQFIALGTSICVVPDQWSRKVGRYQAFQDALRRCRLLDSVGGELAAVFLIKFRIHPSASRSRPSLTEDRRQALIDLGSEVHAKRQLRKRAS